MAKLGKYCKAYPIARLREFDRWSEQLQNARKHSEQEDGKELEVTRQLTDDDYLYLQENYIVTDGIFIDENIIFDQVTPEWIDFCKNHLNFNVPAFESADVSGSQG